MADLEGRPPLPKRVHAFVGALALLAVGAAAVGASHPPATTSVPWAALPFLVVLLALAERLLIRFRFGDEVNGLNLFDAILLPVVVAYPTPVVVGAAAGAQLLAGVVYRNDLVRGSFNVAQWAVAGGLANLAFHSLHDGLSITPLTLVALLAATATIGLVNQCAFVTVVWLAEGGRMRALLEGFAPVAMRGWLAGWVVNTSFGLLFTAAFLLHPVSLVLFVVPLWAMHLAYKGWATAMADRVRLQSVHRASRTLSRPVEPQEALGPFLAEVAEAFGCAGVTLATLDEDGALVAHRWVRGTLEPAVHLLDDGGSLESVLLRRSRPLAVDARSHDLEVRRHLQAAGWRDCVSGPLIEGDQVIGVLATFNVSGLLVGTADQAMIEALARETTSTLVKGATLQASLEERALLSEIVAHASDGILTISEDGTIRTWNAGLAQMTGWSAEEAIGRDITRLVDPIDSDGRPVGLDRWLDLRALPEEIRITTRRGEQRLLQCSFGRIPTSERHRELLLVVARDITGAREVESLRAQIGVLTEREAAQREIADQLQEAVRPAMPTVPGVELAVHYLPSDPAEPTGGDLYDWQVLPDGDVHLAVVDVLGHGVGATKDAMMVTHVLRVLAIEGCPLEDLLGRAEALVSALDGDLVATAIVARFTPSTGRLRLAGAGHPPGLLIRADGEVSELFAPGIALGWPGAGSEEVLEVTLGRWDTLALYTDGLVEATRDVVAGLEMLKRNSAELARHPGSKLACGMVERSLAEGERRDDSLALVLRRRGVTAEELNPRNSFERTLTSGAVGVRRVRAAFEGWLSARQIAAAMRHDLLVVASELLTNAVRAGSERTVLRAAVEGGALVIEVEDEAGGFPAVEDSPCGEAGLELPSSGAEQGRGLYIVRNLVDDLEVYSDSAGTVVRARRALARRVDVAAASDEAAAAAAAAGEQPADGGEQRRGGAVAAPAGTLVERPLA